jgi:hypothetical protein
MRVIVSDFQRKDKIYLVSYTQYEPYYDNVLNIEVNKAIDHLYINAFRAGGWIYTTHVF